MESVARAVVEFDEAVQAPWRPPLVAVPGGRCAASRPAATFRGAPRAAVGRPLGAAGSASSTARCPAAGSSVPRTAGRGRAPAPAGRMPAASAGRRHPGPRREAPALRLTRRARRLGLVLGLAIGVACGSWVGTLVAGHGESGLQLAGETSVVVQPGDTLWSIARSVAGDGDVRPVVDAIQNLNALDGAHLVPGQVLQLP